MEGNEDGSETSEGMRRSVFDEYTEMTEQPTVEGRDGAADAGPERPADAPADTTPSEAPPEPADGAEDSEAARIRREFAEVLGEFRRTAVLVPLGEDPGDGGEPGMLTADFNGIQFILAFSDEQALARYAQARGEYAREWTYRTVLGAKLLDVAVPAAGVPCGVALDCADAPDGGMVFPPVKGIVPDTAAVDIDVHEGDEA